MLVLNILKTSIIKILAANDVKSDCDSFKI